MNDGIIILIIVFSLFFIGSFSILMSVIFEKEEVQIRIRKKPKQPSIEQIYEQQEDFEIKEDYEY